MKRRLMPMLAAVMLAAPALAQENLGRLNGTADYAFINARVYTMNEAAPWAEAVTVEGNRITYVGDAQGLKSQIGFGTEVIDLEGRMVMPGFVEGHFHPVSGAMAMKGVDLQTDDKDELFAMIRTYVAETDDEVILGYGLRFNPWSDGRPTAAMLDEIESERPIYIWAIDLHAAWVNSKALEIAGIDKDTPDTVPGFSRFEREADGNPTGWIIEVPAQLQVFSALVDVDLDYIEDGLKEWLPRFSGAGITTVHDAGVQGIGQAEGYQLLADMAARGELPMRVSGTYYWNDPSVDPLPALLEMRERFASDMVKVEYLKINLDGGDEGWNGLFTEPYVDKPEIVAEPIIPYDILNDVVARADAMGINVMCHCYGDLAVRKLLDAIEAAIVVNPPRERRNKISHSVQVHSDDRARFAELGVIYESHGTWMALDPVMTKMSAVRIGMDRVRALFPIRAIADTGATISLGSDWPASGYFSEYRPLSGIQMAMTRQPIGAPDHPIMGSQAARLTLEQALRANTLGAAIGMNADAVVGSIEVGKMADLIVLEQNLFDVDPQEISDVKVLYTVMDGRLVYAADE